MRTQGKSKEYSDFPSGRVVKEPPANKGTLVQSWSGRIPHAKGQLSSCATNTGARILATAHALQQEKPLR